MYNTQDPPLFFGADSYPLFRGHNQHILNLTNKVEENESRIWFSYGNVYICLND